MSRKRYPGAGGAVSTAVVAFLASGDYPDGNGEDFWEVFDLAGPPTARLFETYERHRAEVEAEATRRGLAEPWVVGRRREVQARGW